MLIKNEEPTKPCNIGTSIKCAWDSEKKESVFQRASFQVGAVGVNSEDYKGTRGNVAIEVQKLGVESLQKMQQIDEALRFIWEEIKDGYPNDTSESGEVE